MYSYSSAYCGTTVFNMLSYLIIDNVSSEDVGNYICSVRTLNAPAAENVNRSVGVVLQAGRDFSVYTSNPWSLILTVHLTCAVPPVQQPFSSANVIVRTSSLQTLALPSFINGWQFPCTMKRFVFFFSLLEQLQLLASPWWLAHVPYT